MDQSKSDSQKPLSFGEFVDQFKILNPGHTGHELETAWTRYQAAQTNNPKSEAQANIEKVTSAEVSKPEIDIQSNSEFGKDSAPSATEESPNKHIWISEKSSESGKPPAITSTEISGPHVRPWLRFWARMFDTVLFVYLSCFFLGLMAAILGMPRLVSLLDFNIFGLGFFVLIAYVFVESCMLCVWCTTPGKALFNIRIRKNNGDKPSFNEALTRSGNVWSRGIGCGIPIITLFTHITAYNKLKNNKVTSWDKDGGFTVSHGAMGAGRLIILILILVGHSALYILVANTPKPTFNSARDEFGGTILRPAPTPQQTNPFGDVAVPTALPDRAKDPAKSALPKPSAPVDLLADTRTPAQAPRDLFADGTLSPSQTDKKPNYFDQYDDGIKTTASGLRYKVVTEGVGRSPSKTDTVTVHYKGWLSNGKVFDSSYDRGQPAQFPVSGVIPGFAEALQLMKIGGKYKLWIPPKLAYGERGAGQDIPPNSTLIFEVELLGVR